MHPVSKLGAVGTYGSLNHFEFMNIDRIISRFGRNGYKITRCMSGKISVKQPNGHTELFESYNEAYRHYFE